MRHLRDPAAADDLVQDVMLLTFDSLRAGKVREPERRAEDVPVDASAHELVVAQSMPRMRAMGSSVTRMRLVATDPDGERLLGEYTFAHTPSVT